jgi:hypothetical protein
MRVSVEPGDVGYIMNPAQVKVSVNGQEVTACIMADEELGLAVCYEQPFRDDGLGNAAEVIHEGVVKIHVPEGWVPMRLTTEAAP